MEVCIKITVVKAFVKAKNILSNKTQALKIISEAQQESTGYQHPMLSFIL